MQAFQLPYRYKQDVEVAHYVQRTVDYNGQARRAGTANDLVQSLWAVAPDISRNGHTKGRNSDDGAESDAEVDENARGFADIEESVEQSENGELNEVDDDNVDGLQDGELQEVLWRHAYQSNVIHVLPITELRISSESVSGSVCLRHSLTREEKRRMHNGPSLYSVSEMLSPKAFNRTYGRDETQGYE
jgi:hypothetical protein